MFSIPQFRDGGSGSVAFTEAVLEVKPNISFFLGFALTLVLAGKNSWAFDVAVLV